MSRLQLAAEGRLDLGIGQPDLRLLPIDDLRRCAAHRLSRPEPAILQYGPEAGSGPFRERLAEYLSAVSERAVSPERLLVSGGASHGLDLILSRFVREGDAVLVEDPSYFLGLEILRGRRVRLIPVPMDRDGLDVDAIASLAKQHRPKLLYTIPIHHNPTSTTLCSWKRERLVELASDHGFFVVADEAYQLLTYEGVPEPSMSTLDPLRVLSLGSFSKILAPGLRLGWIETHQDHVARLSECGVLRSGGGVSPFGAAVVESAMELGALDDVATRLASAYRRRASVLKDALRSKIPSMRFADPMGGFFIWAELPEGVDSARLLVRARELGTGFLAGSRASVSAGFERFVRLCFTYFDETELPIAVDRLATALQKAGTYVQ